MEKTINKGIERLLESIQVGTHPRLDHTNLAEQVQITDEDVFYYLYEKMNYELCKVGVDGEDDVKTDNFCQRIVDILNSEWYRDLYQEHVDRARQGIVDQRELEKTNKSLMATWRP